MGKYIAPLPFFHGDRKSHIFLGRVCESSVCLKLSMKEIIYLLELSRAWRDGLWLHLVELMMDYFLFVNMGVENSKRYRGHAWLVATKCTLDH